MNTNKELLNILLSVIAAFQRYINANENGFEIVEVPSAKKLLDQLDKYEKRALEIVAKK